MYKALQTEAGGVDDLYTWLNGELLLRLWLPPRLRQRREERFPGLAATHTNSA